MTKKDDSRLVFQIKDSDKLSRENINRALRNAHTMTPDEFYFINVKMTKEEAERMSQISADVVYAVTPRWLRDATEADRMAQRIAQLDDSDEDRIVLSDSAEAVKVTAEFAAKVTKAAQRRTATAVEMAEAIESVTPPAPPPKPPGGALVSIARALLSKEAYKRYVEPHIADIQYEYAEEMAKGRKLLALYRVVLGHLLWIVPLGYALWKKLIPFLSFASK